MSAICMGSMFNKVFWVDCWIISQSIFLSLPRAWNNSSLQYWNSQIFQHYVWSRCWIRCDMKMIFFKNVLLQEEDCIQCSNQSWHIDEIWFQREPTACRWQQNISFSAFCENAFFVVNLQRHKCIFITINMAMIHHFCWNRWLFDFSKGWLDIANLKPLPLFISLF